MSERDTDTTRISVDDLVAHAEGRLPAGTPLRARVEAWLQANPEDAARVQAYRHQDRAIRHAWAAIAQAPLPDRLQPGRAATTRTAGMHYGWPAAFAASIALAAVTGWHLGRADMTDTPAVDAFAQQVASEFSGMKIGEPHDGITTVGMTDGPTVRLPGMQFIHQRDEGNLRQFDYTGPDGSPVRLLVASDRAADAGAVRALEGDDFNMVYWQQGSSMYALGGGMAVDTLRALAFNAMADIATAPDASPGQGESARPQFDVEPIPVEPGPEATITPDLPVTRLDVQDSL